ncbi:LysR family transcriptional regulator [Pigmentiphaga aceris]|uniref:LysR family transcriptional regulator n=1 Tax=Pigmentiphaga aceris TaxID=1940612 RepID=A0A5C0B766_9BURK|nr:LysR substrate-binding domain-containing protein [Pigmentiphaga aceris]QEI08881.1 LysR family transcriptional regulator [Pigmentiphaga aceris]
MKRSCPTIQELLALDAIARYQNMTQAAGALCITVSAVSKQLASLESFLGVELLEKHGRSVQLTPVARSYWQRVSGGLREIETASFELRAGANDAAAGTATGLLTLASVPTFLTKWLIPRLPDFRQRHPGITLSFGQHLSRDDAIAPGVDAAIRYGVGQWPELMVEYIGGREFVPIGAPDLLGGKRAEGADALRSQRLLHHEEAPGAWRQWAAQHGAPDLPTLTGPRFTRYSALVQAVASGLGVGLVPRLLVEEELAQGHLITLTGMAVTLDQGHYLCFRAERTESPVLGVFRKWLRDQSHVV